MLCIVRCIVVIALVPLTTRTVRPDIARLYFNNEFVLVPTVKTYVEAIKFMLASTFEARTTCRLVDRLLQYVACISLLRDTDPIR